MNLKVERVPRFVKVKGFSIKSLSIYDLIFFFLKFCNMCKICNRILQVNNLAKSKLQYDVNLITLFSLWLLLFLLLLLLFFMKELA